MFIKNTCTCYSQTKSIDNIQPVHQLKQHFIVEPWSDFLPAYKKKANVSVMISHFIFSISDFI